eukprot:TRINITY_DN1407_c0_g1_i1.p1 TRINITY_DN1407_c0_g1~~TRINITY_DN1407_c0_g1_i1.p1  ORF type:complete len:497 (-),score=121.96 TRINITY_DN1407_c0_g1_i1:116-1606(-)
MASIITKLLSSVFSSKELRGLMLGLDASGRTTALYKLKLGEVVTTIPTIGFNVETIEYRDFAMTFWDVGGCDKIRPLWRHYFQNTSVVLFFIDSNDRERFKEVATEFQKLFLEEELRDAVVVVLANKQDLPNAMTPEEVRAGLRLSEIKERRIELFGTSGVTGDGLYEVMDWITANYNKANPKPPAPPTEPKPQPDRKKDILEEWLEVEDEPDEEFLHKFDTYTLDSWDHRTHLRIAWLLLTRYGRQEGKDRIFEGIRKFIENSTRSRKTTFHETLTYFWIHMVHYAMVATKNPTNDFKGFLLMNPRLSNGGLFLEYYKKDTMMNNPEARKQVILPDIKPLPSIISPLPSQPKPIVIPATSSSPVEDSDELFLSKFENKTLDRWNHHCLLRVIWSYLARDGRRKVVNTIFSSLQEFQKQGFHYSLTYFWIQLVEYYTALTGAKSFSELISAANDLKDEQLYLKYYKKATIMSSQAQSQMVLPDLKPFPSIVTVGKK